VIEEETTEVALAPLRTIGIEAVLVNGTVIDTPTTATAVTLVNATAIATVTTPLASLENRAG
jgi:hypothetical protein